MIMPIALLLSVIAVCLTFLTSQWLTWRMERSKADNQRLASMEQEQARTNVIMQALRNDTKTNADALELLRAKGVLGEVWK